MENDDRCILMMRIFDNLHKVRDDFEKLDSTSYFAPAIDDLILYIQKIYVQEK